MSSKSKDFMSDLEMLSSSVEAEVGTIMEAIREQKSKQTSQPSATEAAQHHGVQKEKGRPIRPPVVEASIDSTRPSTTHSPPRPHAPLAEELVIQNVTTRLSRETNELLTDAALRQRLKKESPATRQDIIEMAIRDWLRKHGYSAGSDSQ